MTKKSEAIVETRNPLTFTDISTIRVHRVINTPMRITDVLEHVGGHFEIRDISVAGAARSSVTITPFQPHELMNLGEIIRRIFAENGSVKARGNGQ